MYTNGKKAACIAGVAHNGTYWARNGTYWAHNGTVDFETTCFYLSVVVGSVGLLAMYVHESLAVQYF